MKRDTISIALQIRFALDALQAERFATISAARTEMRKDLILHNRITADFCARRSGDLALSTYDYAAVISDMWAGGAVRVRRTGGRNLDG